MQSHGARLWVRPRTAPWSSSSQAPSASHRLLHLSREWTQGCKISVQVVNGRPRKNYTKYGPGSISSWRKNFVKLESNLLWGLYFHLLSVTLDGSNWCIIINNDALTRGEISKRLYFSKQFRQLRNKHKGIIKPTVLQNSPAPDVSFLWMDAGLDFVWCAYLEALLKLLFGISSRSCSNVSILMKRVSIFFLVEEIYFIILKLCICMWACQYECQRLQRPDFPVTVTGNVDVWPGFWVSNSSTL